jgi:Ran GTPase-activating protein 1
MLVERMTKNLTTPSIFSRKYGLLSKEEAEVDAKEIEDAAFVTATQHFEKEPDGDGSSAVQIYACILLQAVFNSTYVILLRYFII